MYIPYKISPPTIPVECVVKEIVMLFVRKMDFCAKCQINHERKIKREDSYKAVAVGIKNTWGPFFYNITSQAAVDQIELHTSTQ